MIVCLILCLSCKTKISFIKCTSSVPFYYNHATYSKMVSMCLLVELGEQYKDNVEVMIHDFA